MELRVQKLHDKAKLPSFAHEPDAGMDLFCVEKVIVNHKERAQVRTGIALGIPAGYVGLIWDKSGVSHKRGIKTLGGVIDSGYTGEVLVGVYNTDREAQIFEVGDKIAQILIQKVEHPDITEVPTLEETPRGDGAFGSTGT